MFFLLISREIIELPITLFMLTRKKFMMKATITQKATTALQFITMPMLFLELKFSVYFVILTSFIGAIAGLRYAKNVLISNKFKRN